MSTPRPNKARIALLAAFALLPLAPLAGAQSAPPATVPPAPPSTGAAPSATGAPPPSVSLSDFAWLSGCWRGTVNQREFREHWLPLRGNLLIGAGHTVVQERTQDFEFVRIEPRGDALHYVMQPSGGRESSFRLAGRQEDGADTIFTFASDGQDFPQRIVYRRGSEGWLYIHVEGRLQGEERRVIYPLRRIDCESGEILGR